MSIQLHGVAISNFYNITKLAMLEKDIPFEEVMTQPSKEEEYLTMSPMGKIPCIKTEAGFLSEALAILMYLEKVKPEPALIPASADGAARAMQIYQMIDHYIDPCGRNVLGMAIFGQPVDQEKVAEQLKKLEFATKALSRVVRFDPFIAGDTLTIADLNASVTISYVGMVMTMLAERNPLLEIDGIKDYFKMLAERPHFQRVYKERDATLKAITGK